MTEMSPVERNSIMNASERAMSVEAMKNLLYEQWSNNACLGYLLAALEDLGYSEKEIQNIILTTQSNFNSMTTQEAADYYCHSKF